MFQHFHKRKFKTGFTLVELIVVLVILAIIAAFTIPAMLGYIDKTREADAINNAQYYVTAAQTCIVKKTADETWETLSNTEKVAAINEEASTTAGLSTGAVTSATYDETTAQIVTLLYKDTPTNLLVLYENETYTIVEDTTLSMPDSLVLLLTEGRVFNGSNPEDEATILEQLGLEDQSFTINGITYYIRADAQYKTGASGQRAVIYASTDSDYDKRNYPSSYIASYYYSDDQDQWYEVTNADNELSSTSIHSSSNYNAIESAINDNKGSYTTGTDTYTFVPVDLN